jgi:hypothetical protein
VSDGLDRLNDAIYLSSLEAGGLDESFDRMYGLLLAHHRERGTRQASFTASWQSRAGWLLGEGYDEREVAVRVGVSLRGVQALVTLLRSLYGVGGESAWREAA